MRLRDKMTLWVTLLTAFTAAAFAAVIYTMTSYVLEEILEQNVRLSLTQVVAQIENEDGMLTYENEVPISSGMYFVTEENGSELYSYGADITLFDSVPVLPGVFRRIKGDAETWLLLDSDIVPVDEFSLRVRVAASCAANERILSTLRLIFLIAIPFVSLLALLGGRFIAGRSLHPIQKIIQSANTIRSGELSARIPPAPAKDELGELTDTLNNMLESVETTLNREKRFTSDASHELRTPVAVLRAYAESLLTESSLSDEQRGELATMLRECERMQKIIGQLLTITRGQEGRYPVCMEPMCLHELCEGVAETLADRLTEKGVQLNVDVPDALTVTADQSLLTELLLNLCENAAKYGKPHGRIDVRGAVADDRLVLTVADDGIGIPPEALPHIFERFYRVDAARDRSGTGLGLSICDWIAKAHGGSIRAESVLGAGTTFIVTLPMATRCPRSQPCH